MCASSERTKNGWAEELHNVMPAALTRATARVRLHGVLIDHRKLEALLDDLIGLGEGWVRIAFDEPFAVADIAAEPFADAGDIVKLAGARPSLVQQRRAFGPRRIDVARHKAVLVLHIDQRQRLLGDQRVFSGDHRHRFADKAHPVGRHHRAIAQTIAIIRIDVVEILAGKNGDDAG